MKNVGRTVGKRVIALLSVLCILCSLIVVPASATSSGNYLYNGVELPDINMVWTDKETYPYAIIEYYEYPENVDGGGQTARLTCSSEPILYNLFGHHYVLGDVRYYYFSTNEALWDRCFGVSEPYPTINEWVMAGEEHFDERTTFTVRPPAAKLTWANHDVVGYGNETVVFLAASEPIPVGGVSKSFSVKIYDDVGILDDCTVPEGSYLYIGSYGYDIIGPDNVVIGGSSLDPALSGSMFCGLTANSSAEVATYGPGTTLNITQDLVYYVVLKDTYKVNLYSQYGNLIDIIDCTEGQTAVTINLGSLDFDLWNGPDFRYGFNLGAGEMILGLSSSPSSQYAYQWGVGETVYIDGPMYLYVIKSYPYPVVLNFNNGVDINTFTGFQKSTIRVNESSIDFIDYEGNVQSYSIPLSGTDDAFWGLATSPNQSTPEYVPGDVIYAYDTTELYLVRKSDYYSAISGGGGSGDSGGTGDSGSTPDQVVGDVPDVGDFVSDQAISSISDIFASVFNSPLILSIFMISVVLMFVSYVLFGKKT